MLGVVESPELFNDQVPASKSHWRCFVAGSTRLPCPGQGVQACLRDMPFAREAKEFALQEIQDGVDLRRPGP